MIAYPAKSRLRGHHDHVLWYVSPSYNESHDGADDHDELADDGKALENLEARRTVNLSGLLAVVWARN